MLQLHMGMCAGHMSNDASIRHCTHYFFVAADACLVVGNDPGPAGSLQAPGIPGHPSRVKAPFAEPQSG
jgi:hypothetical protein